ncbi:unnamed protein product [Schistosoma mattheei]|uniref:Uncharacterized protein n=1 Tax=Schistosoma mattheei TaxID=31246 RepID=A0A183PQF4_9TREM|nr:unnamed protein product [Schistosoma mattheei]
MFNCQIISRIPLNTVTKLIRMNMPVDENGCVNFTTTLLALIRESLGIKTGPTEIMDQRDMELKETICKLWPVHGKKMLNLLVPPDSELVYHKMTVGKIYASYLMIENWRATRAFQGKGGTSKSASILARFFGAVKQNAHHPNVNSETEDERGSSDCFTHKLYVYFLVLGYEDNPILLKLIKLENQRKPEGTVRSFRLGTKLLDSAHP